MAQRTTKLQHCGQPTGNAYSFDERVLDGHSGLNIKVFDDYSVEWAQFILMNRNNNADKQAHTHDIVVGPIANDTVGVQLRRFINGYMPIEKMIEELSFKGNHAMQYFFETENAIKFLTKV